MFTYKRSELSEYELATMKCIWDAKEPITCQEIMGRLRDEYGLDYQDTTVYTYLKKLKMKGFISSYRRGVIFFEAVRSEDDYRDEQVKKTEDFWFRGSTQDMIAALVSRKKFTKQEKEDIKKLIDEWYN
ncbi:MAG: BlaI/MecI/CopY family transcriptional regulator [Lachnospira sp.]|nr:BlaI/MecI/CopY family transcriptional regulator [Lachnospira sp.]